MPSESVLQGPVVRPEVLPSRVRNNPARRAEVYLYDQLRQQLGAGWVLFYSVAWLSPKETGGHQDGETDFIVAHPSRGILLIEVKGGQIRFDERRRQWISRDSLGEDHDIDPFEQLRKSKYALLRKLKILPVLQSCWIELSQAVAFPDVARPRFAVTPDAPPEIMIGLDDVGQLSTRIEEILHFSSSGTDRQFENGGLIVREMVRIFGQSTTLRNPLALVTAEEDKEIVRLTEEQFSLLDTLNRVRRAAIRGCAGTGKTFLAVEKAKRLANEGFRTLLTCFNRPLAEHLRRVTAGAPNLDVATFHSVCASFAREAGLPLGENFDEYPAALSDAVAMRPDLKYDAIIVDEGQDFQDHWWIALEDCLRDPKSGVFYIFHDSNQILYRDRGALPDGFIELDLVDNVRNTRSIFAVLKQFHQGELSPRPRGPVGRTVEYHTYATSADLGRVLAKVLRRLLIDGGFKTEDVVVLTPHSLDRSDLLHLPLPGSFRLVSGQPTSNNQVLLSTVHSFKGLERRVAIVTELDEQLQEDALRRSAVCYVAFSRPRTQLVLLGTPDVLPGLLPPVKSS